MSLKHSLLALLSSGPKTGYDLSKDFEGSTGFFWTATHQQIYKYLHELEKDGHVRFRTLTQNAKPDKKIYSISRNGREELKRWISSEESPETPSKDAFLIKLFVGDLVESKVLLTELSRQKKGHEERLDRYQEIEAQYFKHMKNAPERRHFQYLTLKRGILFERSWLEWSREVEKMLKGRAR